MGATLGCLLDPAPSSAVLNAASDGDVEAVRTAAALEPEVLWMGSVGLQDTCWHLAAAYGQLGVLEALWQLLVEKREIGAKVALFRPALCSLCSCSSLGMCT